MSATVEIDHSIGRNTVVDGVHFHPNNETYITSSGWNVTIGQWTSSAQEFLRGHSDHITATCMSPSGRYMASGQGGDCSDVLVWDLEAKQCIYQFEEHDFGIKALSFSHDERLLASLGHEEDGKLIVWDMSNGCIVGVTNKVPRDTCCIQFGGFVKDIKRRDTASYQLVSGGGDGLLRWSLDPFNGDFEAVKLAGDARATISRRITSLSFSSDYSTLYGASPSGDFVVANLKALKIITSVLAAKQGLQIVKTRGSRELVTGGGDGVLKLFVDRGEYNFQLVREVQLSGLINSVSLSGDQLEALVGTIQGALYRVNLNNMNFLTVTESHTDSVVAVTCSNKIRDKFVTASRDGTIRVWDLVEYALSAVGYARNNGNAAATPVCLDASDIILSGWSNGVIYAHNIDTGANLWFIENAHAQAVTALKISNNGRFIISGGNQGDVRLWELRTRDLISHFKEHTQKITSITVTDDDLYAFTSSKDRNILKWDLRREKRIQAITQRMGGVNSICLSRDQSRVISTGQEKMVVYWNSVHASTVIQTPVRDSAIEDEAGCICVSNDGGFLATGCISGALIIWNYETCAIVANIQAHSGPLLGVAFTYDDQNIITCGEDKCVSIWSIFRDV